MAVVVWVAEGTWQACIDAMRMYVPARTPVVLLHVSPEDVAGAAHGAFAGLMGRGHPRSSPPDGWGSDPGTRMEALADAAGRRLLDAAAERLGRPCTRVECAGRVEHEVVTAAAGADLLVLARDGDRTRPGPRSLAPATRFAVDHAACPVLLVWPAPPQAPALPPGAH
ncbi:universal stress protein [Kitasatospora sp. KL5]|uniref:universal stress protein n=1 Tax=Kitasatospora sp. KL5 TaxID=3425125 RepID=UPI003D6DC730